MSADDHGRRLLPAGEGELILLVEDDEAWREANAEVLRALGYRVLEAENAEEAWEQWERHGEEIALVLTDLMLPGVSDAYLCSALNGQDSVPVIVISGHPIDAEDDRLAGVTHRLQKPFRIERLARVIYDTLGTARS